MLQLKNIIKNYYVGDLTVEALKGVNISFRKSEFVSILGPSGCGKTTLLNIIGGLDRYTKGDIVINGVSTTLYTDRDWDTYRNHKIGFVFQSYNLIPHQTVLENVELALTLTGIKSKERKERAINALEKVGLKGHEKKLPSQLSGGQMQRVAIARAIVNDPEIILADEPTGALDTETSIQVMNILKELSKNKLIIMVTHNPDLAEAYSSRIIKLKDGEVREDSNPFEYTYIEKKTTPSEDEKTDNKKSKKTSMSFWTAMSLSFKNLKTKMARTLLTSFAGSIGIIGIALILSLSSGFSAYVEKVQRDTLSNYPVSINKNTMDMTSFATSYMGASDTTGLKPFPDSDTVEPNKMIEGMLNTVSKSMGANDLVAFKKYLDENKDKLDSTKISAISYSYNFDMNIYDAQNPTRKINKINDIINYLPDEIPDVLPGVTLEKIRTMMTPMFQQFKRMMETSGTWGELIGNNNLIKSQYDLLEGEWPSQENVAPGEPWPIMIVVDKYNRIPDYALYLMGLMDNRDVKYIFSDMIFKIMEKTGGAQKGFTAEAELKRQFGDYTPYSKEMKIADLIGKQYNVMLSGEYYQQTDSKKIDEHVYNVYTKQEDGTDFVNNAIKNSAKIEVVGVLRLKKGVASGALSQNMYYTPAFKNYLIDRTQNIPVVKDQKFNDNNQIDLDQKMIFDAIQGKFVHMGTPAADILQENRHMIGMVDKDNPASIDIYPNSFENKDYVVNIIDEYNTINGEKNSIQYTDYVGMMMSSVTTIINAITYVLIAFVSVSLIVSSIMIGVITYISVLERTKEIGILRSIGASKKDIGRVFNAETVIIGFTAGIIGVVVTILLNIPISFIIDKLSGIPGVAALPFIGALVLITISILLTLLAGLIPSKMASKKDPVIALRTE